MASMDLDVVAAELVGTGIEADVRGRGSAPFIFARYAGRAVEISACEGSVWVEFWERDEESPKFDRTFAEDSEAIATAREWLMGEAG